MEPVTAFKKKLTAFFLSCLIAMATTPDINATLQTQSTQPAAQAPSSSYTGQGAPLSAVELHSLVSPIALYPDSLVAQILSAATFPDEVAVANYWLQQNKTMTGSALMQAVNKQSWDPSVKALTQFPTVLNNMAQNLSWTSQLGEAYHNQSSEVMSAIQTLREQAKAAGNLKTTPQQTVKTESQNSQQVIVIQPANPQVVYVPSYNPTVVYGTPYNPPGYSTADLVTTSLLSFGAGIAVGSLISGGGGCCGWGWSSWSCNWYGGGAYYHGGAYYGNAAWHGGYYNNGYHPYNGGYNPSGYHPNYNSGYQHLQQTNYKRTTNVSGNALNLNRSDSNSWDKSGWSNSDAARGWGSDNDSGRSLGSSSHSTAFSGYGDHSGSAFGSGGWADRSSSFRGWGSRGGGGGWGGGRFGGGGGFRGGGFRR
jgi:hypothetical protein